MEKEDTLKKFSRPPIVVVLGHVDHGKTTLLDAIRATNIAQREVGGITQGIGASVVENKEGKKITFIDTPGHAAFGKMRSRGAKVADIAILVVAADDGVKPQTKEALNFIREANIPFIVAATKIDLPTASVESIKAQLKDEAVVFEDEGGDVPLIAVSAKLGKGIQELLDMILLISELNEVKGDPEGPLEAVVIETGKGKAGPMATVVVRNGKIKRGDEIVVQTTSTKVRAIFDSRQKAIRQVNPGEAALILGFEEPPEVGSKIEGRTDVTYPNLSKGRQVVEIKPREGQIPIVLKAQNAGSLEAILENLPQKIVVIHSGLGDVNESDVFLAKTAGARIFSFEARVSPNVVRLAETEGVTISRFSIIYELFEAIEELIKKDKIEEVGLAEVIAIFPFEGKRVAGCKIVRGKISKTDSLFLKRGERQLGLVKILSMKKAKVDIQEARQGEECGIFFAPQLDFKVGDVLLSLSQKAK